MSRNTLQTIQVLPTNGILKATIEKFLTIDKAPSNLAENDTILQEADICDFGVRFKITALQTPNGSVRTDLCVSIPEWSRCREDSTRRLVHIYKDSFKEKNTSEEAYNFIINVNDAVSYFGSSEECAESLSQIRIQSMGSPIFYAMERILQKEKQQNESHEVVSLIPSHPRCGECRCIGFDDKVMIIYTVRIEDEMERALARVFVQQFAGAQKQVSQTPHCEFRRGNDPPKELLSSHCSDAMRENSNGKAASPLVGYLAFTFFPSHLKSPQRLFKAVELMVNFLPYLDKHLKSTKSFMHGRMRAKKDDLLRELKESVGPADATTKFGKILIKRGKHHPLMSNNPRLAVAAT